MFKRILLCLPPVLAFFGTASAQPACSFSLGPDVTICAGQTATLTAPAGYANYLWNTGATTSSITTGTAGNYTCQITYNTTNLVTNGDFTAGNTGFTTQYNYNANMQVEGNYFIGLNAGTYHPFWQGSSSGNFLMVNAGLFQSFSNFWCQNITVCPGATYTFLFDAANLADVGPANVQLTVGGTVISAFPIAGFLGTWNTYSATWTAGPGQTTANFCLRMINTNGTGHDLGVDNISLTSTIVMTDDINVNVNPVPPVSLGPDITGCAGTPVTLSINVPGAQNYTWSTSQVGTSINVNTTGTYWVDVLTANNCVVRDSINVTINPLPLVYLGLDFDICPGTTTVLDATLPGATYLWNTGAVTPTITVGPGNYSVQVIVNGCSSTDGVLIGTLPAPPLDLGPDTTLCPGETITLDATGNGFSYLWQDNSTNSTLFVNQAGTYSVTVTDVNNCVAQDTVEVTYNVPQPVFLGNDTTICANSGYVLDAYIPGATYLWNTGSTDSAIVVNTAGFYFVDVDQGNCTVNASIQISTLPSPLVNLGPDVTLCPGATVLLDVTNPIMTYVWQDGSTGPTFLVDTAGQYYVSVTNPFGCTTTDTLNVTYQSGNGLNLGNDTTICQGSSLLLNATTPTATAYLWNTGSVAPTLNVSTAGTYFVRVTLPGGCFVRDTIAVSVNPVPTVALGNDTTLCTGATLTLDATQPGVTYSWSTGAITPTIVASSAGTYWVEVDLNGCTASDTIAVSYLSGSISLGNDTTLCQGQTLGLNATLPGGTTTWSTGAIGTSITVGTTGTYWATVDVGGCSLSDTIQVDIVPVPMVDLGNDTTFCQGGSVLLDATNAGATYTWSTGAASATLSASSTGTYWVEASIGNCSASDTVQITVNPLPQFSLGNDTTLCAGNSVLLDATTPGATYLWPGGNTTATQLADTTGNYSVTVTVNGCSSTDAILVTVLAAASVDLGNDTILCAGETLLLDATLAGATYTWSTGASSATLNVTSAGTYWVSAAIGGCSAGDTITVGYVGSGAIDLGPDQVLCPGETAVFDVTIAGASYLWQDGSTSASYTAANTGMYWVDVILSGCVASDTVNVLAVQLDTPDLGPDQVLCDGQVLELGVVPNGADVLWWNGSTQDSVSVTTTTNVTVTFTSNGCTTSDAMQVTFLQGTPQVDLGGFVELCFGRTVDLDASALGASHLWSTGSTDPVITVDELGVYWVQLIDACGTTSDTVQVIEGTCEIYVYTPNAFTPNGDGYNEYFAPVVLGTTLKYELNIFDRWGNVIYTTDSSEDPWDGKMNGNVVQDGVYIWQLRYKAVTEDGVVQDEVIGHVSLLR